MIKVILFCLLAAGFISSNASRAEVYVVDSNDSLQRLYNIQISNNDDIYFMPGEYALTKSIKINNSNVTIGSRTNKDSVSIDCPILKKTGDFHAIRLNGDNNKVICIAVDGNGNGGAGISVYGSSNVLSRVTSSNNHGAGILLHGNGPIGNGSCKNNIIKQAVISNNGKVGLSQFNCQGNQISDSEMTGNRLEGITIDAGSHDTSVTHSNIKLNKGGVAGVGIDYSRNVKLSHNEIIGNKKGGVRTQNNIGPTQNLIISCNNFNNPEYDVWLRNNTCDGNSRSKCEKWSNITPISALHDAPNASLMYNHVLGQGIKVDLKSNLQRSKSDSSPDAQAYCNAN